MDVPKKMIRILMATADAWMDFIPATADMNPPKQEEFLDRLRFALNQPLPTLKDMGYVSEPPLSHP